MTGSRTLPTVVLVLAVLSLLVSLFTLSRVGKLVKAHNSLVAQLNKERSGLGALLDAAGVPGGKAIGALLNSATSGPAATRGRESGLHDRLDRRRRR